MNEDTRQALRWFNGLSQEDKQKTALKAGGRGADKITKYWLSIQGRS